MELVERGTLKKALAAARKQSRALASRDGERRGGRERGVSVGGASTISDVEGGGESEAEEEEEPEPEPEPKVGTEEEGEEAGAGKDDADALDCFFPFDPYLLRTSSRYVTQVDV